MGGLGIWEIALILVGILLLFGGRKIPQLARALGTGLREFKKTLGDTVKEITDVRHEIEDTSAHEPTAAPKKKKKTARKKA